jgi:feruloyl esterase
MTHRFVLALAVGGVLTATAVTARRQVAPAAERPSVVTVQPAVCTADRIGASIAPGSIGEPVSAVTLSPPRWMDATAAVPAHCLVDGVMSPIDQRPAARPIHFRVALPASWNLRAVQLGGGGMDGIIPNLTAGPGNPFARGYATFGSDSGHAINDPPEWTLNDEAIRNLGFMQLKKTHDAAMVLIERAYGRRPAFTYFVGTSQGGREALTVAQRYPADYDGVAANVPIVSFSTLMLAPELIRIREKPLSAWVPPAKVNTIRGEFMRQCDGLDNLPDGIINNYPACRARFDGSAQPAAAAWAARRCAGATDPNPADTSAAACLTDDQIATLGLIYSRYHFRTPLANDVTTFGMWVPNTDPSGSGLLSATRFRGQEGAAPDAPLHSHLGVLGVTGFLMRDVAANPLDYVEGGPWDARRRELSAWLDSTAPDLTPFRRRGGRLIVAIGTNDTLASPGAQLDYYQAVLDAMGRAAVDEFARFYVLPQTGHGLTGTNYTTDGNGRALPAAPIPNTFDRLAMLTEWVESGVAPGKSVEVSAGAKSLPMCSYPTYPRYVSGPPERAQSYVCAD